MTENLILSMFIFIAIIILIMYYYMCFSIFNLENMIRNKNEERILENMETKKEYMEDKRSSEEIYKECLRKMEKIENEMERRGYI